jgi:integrase
MRGDGTLYRQPGSAVWRGQYYVNGRMQNFSTGERDRRKAQKVLRERVALVTTGRVVPEDVRRLRYEDLETGLLADYRMNGRRSLPDLTRVLTRLRAAFSEWRALAITTAHIQAYSAARLDEGAKPATINKELSALGRMFTLAVRDGRMQYRPQVPKLRANNARTGFLEPRDFAAFCAELPKDLQPVARFAYHSGWRKREVLGLTWRQVDLKTGTIRLEAAQSKNGEGRVLAFDGDSALAQVLAEQAACRRLDCPYVFHRNGRPIRDFYTAWRAAAKRAGLGGLMLHDFRRSTARNLVRAGVPERVAMAITGHKTRAIFDRYNIVNERDLRDASVRVTDYVAEREPRENRESGRRIARIGRKDDGATA